MRSPHEIALQCGHLELLCKTLKTVKLQLLASFDTFKSFIFTKFHLLVLTQVRVLVSITCTSLHRWLAAVDPFNQDLGKLSHNRGYLIIYPCLIKLKSYLESINL